MSISVSIWRKTLVRHEACRDGLALFDAIAAQQPANDKLRLKRIRVRNWTPLHSIWAWACAASFAQWCESRQIIPRANLTGANLYLANLYLANLTGADLTGAYLTGANLTGANLNGADLSGAYRGTSPSIPGWHTLVSGYVKRETEATHAVE